MRRTSIIELLPHYIGGPIHLQDGPVSAGLWNLLVVLSIMLSIPAFVFSEDLVACSYFHEHCLENI